MVSFRRPASARAGRSLSPHREEQGMQAAASAHGGDERHGEQQSD